MSNEFHDENNLYHFSYRDPNAESHTESAAGSTVESAAEPVVTDTPVQPKKHHGGVGRVVALILSCAVISAACGFGGAILAQNSSRTGKTTVQQSNRTAATVNVKKVDGQTLMSPSEVYASTVNSVVSINCSAVSTNIFGQQTESASSGSGFIYTADGYIVTNQHVVANASSINVTLYNGDTYPATLVGSDSDYDVAVLKIDAKDLPAVTLGSSTDVNVGDTVLAIGNPLGELTFSMSQGIVSCVNRAINVEGTPFNMIQVDASINPGNSGGPLMNLYGEVVGIVSAKYSSYANTTVEGLGFAIPINDVQSIIKDIIENGSVGNKAYMAITAGTMTQQMAAQEVPEACQAVRRLEKTGRTQRIAGWALVTYAILMGAGLWEGSAGDRIIWLAVAAFPAMAGGCCLHYGRRLAPPLSRIGRIALTVLGAVLAFLFVVGVVVLLDPAEAVDGASVWLTGCAGVGAAALLLSGLRKPRT